MAKPRILLIDDEVIFTDLLRVNLEATGRYEVRSENRGLEGFAVAKTFRPDVIFLDIVMPDIDGTQLAAILQSDPELQRVPIVYLTAVVAKRPGQTTTLGRYAVLAKPVRTDEVVACVERLLGEAPMRDGRPVEEDPAAREPREQGRDA